MCTPHLPKHSHDIGTKHQHCSLRLPLPVAGKHSRICSKRCCADCCGSLSQMVPSCWSSAFRALDCAYRFPDVDGISSRIWIVNVRRLDKRCSSTPLMVYMPALQVSPGQTKKKKKTEQDSKTRVTKCVYILQKSVIFGTLRIGGILICLPFGPPPGPLGVVFFAERALVLRFC